MALNMGETRGGAVTLCAKLEVNKLNISACIRRLSTTIAIVRSASQAKILVANCWVAKLEIIRGKCYTEILSGNAVQRKSPRPSVKNLEMEFLPDETLIKKIREKKRKLKFKHYCDEGSISQVQHIKKYMQC